MADDPTSSFVGDDVDIILSKHQLHLAVLGDRFTILEEAEEDQRRKLVAKGQEIALLKERINELEFLLDERAAEAERAAAVASEKAEENTRALVADLERVKLSYQQSVNLLHEAQNEIATQSSTIFDLESQIRKVQGNNSGVLTTTTIGQADAGSLPQSSLSLAKLLGDLHERHERFRVFLGKVAAQIQQLGALHKQVAARQNRLGKMLNVALALRTSGQSMASKELKSTVRHLEGQNAALLRSLSSAEAAMREEKANTNVLKEDMDALRRNLEVINSENQVLEKTNRSLLQLAHILKSRLAKVTKVELSTIRDDEFNAEDARLPATAASVENAEETSSFTAAANQETLSPSNALFTDVPLEARCADEPLNGGSTPSVDALLPFSPSVVTPNRRMEQQGTPSVAQIDNRSALERDGAVRVSLQSVPGYSSLQSEQVTFIISEIYRTSNWSPNSKTELSSACPVLENIPITASSSAEPQQSIQQSPREELLADYVPLMLEGQCSEGLNRTNRESPQIHSADGGIPGGSSPSSCRLYCVKNLELSR